MNSVIHSVLHIAPENNRPEDVVARAMLTHILRYEKTLNRDIVHDYVVRPEYAVLYLQALGHLLSEMVGH